MQGKVSMVVPCYNKEAFIGAMLDSVISQKWDNIELILVNDGSTDNTRQIIAEYELRFRERGYDYIVIDQQNAGCCAAVHAGMLRMSGSYFCLVDCDDELMPEYVSRMAGWLDENPEYDWASCSYQRICNGDNGLIVLPPILKEVHQDAPHMIENYILRQISTFAWIYMMRTSYVKKSRMIESFCTERRSTYEPCIVVPPAVAGGKLKSFDEPLYKYNIHASELFSFSNYEDAIKYYGDYLYLYEWVINNLDIADDDKKRYLAQAQFTHLWQLGTHLNIQNGENYSRFVADKTALLINRMFYPSPNVSADILLDTGLVSLQNIVRHMLHSKYMTFEQLANTAGRVIGYGALGRWGRKDLPLLRSTVLWPSVIWDKAAQKDSTICDIPAEKPDLKSLTKSDVIIVFPRDFNVLEDIKMTLQKTSAGSVLYYPEIKKTLSVLSSIPALATSQFMPSQRS